jgi:2-keto-4-pentenoate hydratase/2-oxohepta-3-ene-1,7-dioic acid hydratase in catechol pathway
MRFVTTETASGPRAGLVLDGRVVLLDAYPSLLDLIAAGPAALAALRGSLADFAQRPGVPLDLSRLLAPIPRPRKNVFCVGMNYAAHARESLIAKGLEPTLPAHPVFFTKAPTTVNRPTGEIVIDPAVSDKLDWEVELAVIIGAGGKNISRAAALDHVWGYTVLNDVSARDLQRRHDQFFKGKSLDGSCPMGPWIVTADEIADPHALTVRLSINGVVKQESTTADLIFDIPTLIEVLSAGMTLEPGDIIATGTPAGVGFARTPAEYLRPGDLMETEIDGIGALRNPIIGC